MLFEIREYFNFLVKSTNQYGVHSPFVFDLITKCLYDKKKYPDYAHLNKYRNTLLRNKSTIKVTDFGAGSRVFKSNDRMISQMVKMAGISSFRSRALYRLVKYFEPQTILEIGTSLGLATASMAYANRNAAITSIEGCINTSANAHKFLKDLNLDNVEVVCTQFEEYINCLTNENFDLIYFDGNHTKEATLYYFNAMLRTVNNESCWVFDDIHWSVGMSEAWEEIKRNPLVTVTIDTFQWGLVFFRKEQVKEDFTIRL